MRVIEESKEVGMAVNDFRSACNEMILNGDASPGHLILQGLAQRLNIIFDIDNTLVHSVAASQVSPELQPVAKKFQQRLRK